MTGQARAQQNTRARSRLAAVDQFLNARPDATQNLRAVAHETGTMKNLFIDGGTLSEPESDTPDNIARGFLNRHADLFAIKAADNSSLKLMKEDNNVQSVVAKTFDAFANGPLNRSPFTIYGSSYCSPAGCFPNIGSTSNLFADIVLNSPQ